MASKSLSLRFREEPAVSQPSVGMLPSRLSEGQGSNTATISMFGMTRGQLEGQRRVLGIAGRNQCILGTEAGATGKHGVRGEPRMQTGHRWAATWNKFWAMKSLMCRRTLSARVRLQKLCAEIVLAWGERRA